VQASQALGVETRQPLVGATLRDPKTRRDRRDRLVEVDNAPDHLDSTQHREFGLTVRVHAAVVFGSVLFSHLHFSNSSPHEQPIGTSQLAKDL